MTIDVAPPTGRKKVPIFSSRISDHTAAALVRIYDRIKGARLWRGAGNIIRIYLPHRNDLAGVRAECYIEVINDRLELVVKARSRHANRQWCEAQAAELKSRLLERYHEIIFDCEKRRRKVPLNERLTDDVPPLCEGSMEHQKRALGFLCSMKVSACFGDTGVGKTKIATDLACSRFAAGRIDSVMVFCPLSTVDNFSREVELFCRENGLVWRYYGIESMSMSDRIYLEARHAVDNRTMIVIDESHMVKGAKAMRSRRIREICDRCSYKLIMSATPVTDNVHDLYMQYGMLSELILGCSSWEKFARKFLILGGWDGNQIVGYKNLEYLAGLIEPYTCQILRKDAMTLPPKEFLIMTCELTDEQQFHYRRLKKELLDAISASHDDMRPETIFLYFIRMQQVACGYLHDGKEGARFLGTRKFELLERLGVGRQTIFFCKYLFEVDILMNYLGRSKCAEFTGRNRRKRAGELCQFVAGNKPYFVATSSIGGTGLNGLQGCNRIVFFSNSFKYSERKQCIGRIDRKGQRRNMKIIDMITSTGIDARIMHNLARKRNMTDEILRLITNKAKLREYVQAM
ncbi:MAG: DEAD/DEAH box helicase [Rikenellaceae bacterium]|jgi:SNF2 family DNA or RNA helicase|nr:DEAD/DEAH box helicase [Rikenellaceae bacterium]